jgi:hypothetical protein
MAATLFDAAAEGLEQHTGFDRLAARGTLRLALKESGLDVDSVVLDQLVVVFAKVMPEQLRMRAVKDEVAVCEAVVAGLLASGDAAAKPSSDKIFGRLGGD